MMDLINIEKFCSILDVLYLMGNKTTTEQQKDLPVFMEFEVISTIMSKIETVPNYDMYDFPTEASDFLNHTINFTDILPICEKFIQKIHNVSSFNMLRFNLIKYIYPILLIFGIFGNTLSFLVMLRIYRTKKKRPNRNFSFCLAMLCFADLAILLVGCLREYFEEVFSMSIRSSTIYSCKIFYFTCYLFSAFSSYLYAFIAVERWQAVTRPIKYKQQKAVQNQKTIILIFVYCICISLPFLILPTLQKSITPMRNVPNDFKIEPKCEISHSIILSDLLIMLLDSLFYCLIPFLVTIFFSILTWIKLIMTRRSNSTQLAVVVVNAANISASAEEINTLTKINTKQSSKLKMTVMLLTLPISYLLTTFPIFVIILFQLNFNYFRKKNSYNYETEFAISRMLMYINNSINILFFILFGKSLRKDFLKIFTSRACGSSAFNSENMPPENSTTEYQTRVRVGEDSIRHKFEPLMI